MQRIKSDEKDIEALKKQLDSLKGKTIKDTITLHLMDSVKAIKPKIYITATAYVKMQAVVNKSNLEVGWHLLMHKHKTGLFEINDILIYPQKTTATYIEVDDEERAKWQNGLDINVFKAIHGQVHSHVNMSCTPSGVDRTHYDEVAALIKHKPENYYLFAIVNKKGEIYANFYDYEQNIIFETKEIELVIMSEDGTNIIKQVEKELDQKIKIQAPKQTIKVPKQQKQLSMLAQEKPDYFETEEEYYKKNWESEYDRYY